MANQRDRILSLVDEQMDSMSDRMQNMVISASAGRPSNESALTTSTVDGSEFTGIDIGEHDSIPIGQVNEKDNRPVKRRCFTAKKILDGSAVMRVARASQRNTRIRCSTEHGSVTHTWGPEII